jgi:hypothetical protein
VRGKRCGRRSAGASGPGTPASTRTRALATATAVLVLALALSAVLGACHAGGARVTGTAAAHAAGAPASGAAGTVAARRACQTAELEVAPVRHELKQGLDIERFAVTTATESGCTLKGAPNLSPKGPLSPQQSGSTVDLAVSQLPVPDDVGLDAGDGGAVALLPGRTAYFYLAWYSASPVVCVNSDGFGFNAPGDTAYRDLALVRYRLGPVCDGIFYVSPVFAQTAES